MGRRLSRALAVVALLLALGAIGWLAPAPAPAAFDPEREERQEWEGVYAPPWRRVVRVVVFSRGERILRAAVRRTDRTIRVTLIKRYIASDTPVSNVGYVFCVEVRLGERVGSRRVVDGATGRAYRSYPSLITGGDRPCGGRVPTNYHA